eukprot:TRINITY_DN3262_c2_g1_i6.p1 TRINITY_DN3262_c2_g1~~TRINITY_DN3262_c2_g1_i6.p1  ORF type:complete len:212 (+),score=6.12 TRINITY_DN3262_c2_g1_i6:128-763(+)
MSSVQRVRTLAGACTVTTTRSTLVQQGVSPLLYSRRTSLYKHITLWSRHMSSASSLTGQEWVHRLARQRPEIPGVVRHALVQQGLQGTQRQTLGDSTRSPRGVNGEYNDGCFTPSATAVDGVSLQQPLVPEQEERLRAIETRLQTQEPVQYIEGAAEFYRRMFTVGPGTLIPREATDTIIDSVLALVPDREQPYKILDLGTGSGCILVGCI